VSGGFDPHEISETPHGTPLVPRFPLRMRDAEILTVAYRTAPQAVERFLPRGLEPAAPRAIATMPYKQQTGTVEELDALGFRTNLNLKAVPAVDGSGAAVRQVTAREFEDVVVHEVWRGPGTVELRPNAQAPVHWRVDFTLTYGRVLEELR